MAGLKNFRIAVLNHVQGKHLTCTMDAADPLRNEILSAIATIFRMHGRTWEATQAETYISKLIVSRGEGPEVVHVRTTIDAPHTVGPITADKITPGTVVASRSEDTT